MSHSNSTPHILKISTVVESVVHLRPVNGVSEPVYAGYCPFCEGPDETFTVLDDANLYECRACGAMGDMIGFVKETQNLSFMDAVCYLADKAGIALPAEGSS